MQTKASTRTERKEISLDVERALHAVRTVVDRTPLVRAPDLDGLVGRPVWLKLESLQQTGSFKVRGAAAHLMALDPEARARGVITCSSGNHGRAVAYVSERLGIEATVCLPSWVDPVKLEAMRGHGARTELVGDTYDEAEARALEIAAEQGLSFVPPFDDEAVAAGQATVAVEIVEDLPGVAEVAVPLSGGGLVGGMAWWLARHAPHVRVTAVSAFEADVMVRSLRAGRPVQVQENETLATALSGGIGADNRVTFDLVRDHVHRHVSVHEGAIVEALRRAYRSGLLVEGGGAVALAAVLESRLAVPFVPGRGLQPLVVVVSGGNLDPQVLRPLLFGPPL